jgi:hypothetical protein
LPDHEEKHPESHPPYVDGSLVINTRLNEIERRQREEEKEEREYKRRQLRFNRWTVIFTGLLFLTSTVSSVVLIRQTKASKQSADAATSAAKTASDTLTEIRNSASDTHDLAVAAKAQADNTRTLAEQTKIALHVTERAYVVAGPPDLSTARHTVRVIFNNIGHIPSGRLEIITHEATINLESSGQLPDLKKAAEWHWSQSIVQALSPGPGLAVNVPVVLVQETKMQQGLQTIVIVGKFRYQDGFPDDGTQNGSFCFQSFVLTEQKLVVWRERNPIGILRTMEALDGYPKNGALDR